MSCNAFLVLPDDTSVPSRGEKRPMIWKYGRIEYRFSAEDGRVRLIYEELDDGTPRVLAQSAENRFTAS